MDVVAKLSGGAGGQSGKEPEPSELVRKLISSKKPGELVPFPRNDETGKPVLEYFCQILTQSELDEARANAAAYTKRKLKELLQLNDAEVTSVRKEAWDEIYNDAKCIELLYLSCRDPANHEHRLFSTPAQLRDRNVGVTLDEIALMFNTYSQVQHRYGPLWRLMSDDEVEAYIERLVAGLDSYPLSHLGQGEQVQLIVSMAHRLHNLKTDTGSSGSPASDTSSDTTPNPTSDA